MKEVHLAGIMRKRLIFIACFLLLSAPSVFADGAAQVPETQKDKESYSIGYQVGLSLKSDSVDVNFDRLIQGLREAIEGKQPLLGTDEMKKLIVDLKKKAREVEMKKLQELIVKNAEESDKFLEENGKKEGVRMTESGLQYKIVKEGDGPVPAPEDLVTVNYRGMFIDGREFDSSFAKGEPQTVKADGVIKGWTEALQMMKTGSKWQIFVPPHLAYGRGGLGERIPPNKVLIFEIELLSVRKEDQAIVQPGAQTARTPAVRQMSITGEIATAEHGYIIRGKTPAEIFTILNPDMKILDGFVKSGRVVPIEVRIVSGDNVDIEKIDGRIYGSGSR